MGISFLTTIQAPSILSETEHSIDQNINEFSKDIVKMDSAVKNMNTVVNDQITKYKLCSRRIIRILGKLSLSLGLQWEKCSMLD